MSRFLRLGAFLSVLFFATNVFASGYTCPSYKRYTSCNPDYYLNGTQAGNSCDLCPSGCTCSGGTAQPDCSIHVTYNLNGGYGTTPSATQCTSGVSCSLQSGATTSFYRAGYVFKGWATTSTATTGSTSITVTASRTVYAVWSKCGAGTYKTSSAQAIAACSSCPEGYRSGAGTTAQSNCTTSCDAGYAVLSANGACTSIQNSTYKGKYIKAHTVNYGATSTINDCPTNYQAGNGTTAKDECKIACRAGNAVLEANGACESIVDDPAYAGYYTDEHTVKYGGKTEILVCPDDYGARLTGSETKFSCQTICHAGYAVLTAGGVCTSIQNSTYKGKFTTYHTVNYGATSPISTCPTNYQAGNGTTAQSNCTTSCAAGYAVLTARGACTTIQNSTYKGKYITAHTVKYGATSSISTCPTNYQAGNGTTTQANCKASCSAGYAVLTSEGACESIMDDTAYAGHYTDEHTVKYGEKTEILLCPNGYDARLTGSESKSSCQIACPAGYAVVNPEFGCVNIMNDEYTGQYTDEHNVSYGDISVIQMCPDGYGDGKGTNTIEGCQASCAAGSAVLTAGGACESMMDDEHVGMYTDDHIVSYGDISVIETCPDGYRDGEGAVTREGCQVSCAAGYAVLTAGGACTSIQNSTYKGKYITAHMVNYGDTTTISTCPTNYQAGNGTTAQSNCTTSCSAGYAVLSANGACTSIQNATYKGKYITAHTVKYGGKSTINDCPTNYQAGNGTTAKSNCTTSCSAGYAVLSANGACESIMDDTAYAGQYTDDHTVKYGDKTEILVCPDGYGARLTGSESKSDCQTICNAGYAVLSEAGECTSIQNSTYKGKFTTYHTVNYGGKSTISTCPTNYQAGNGTTAESNCTASCAAGTRVASAKAACSAVTSGNVYMLAHTVKYGSTSAAATSCPSGYTISGTTQSDHDAKADCKITCSAGTRVASADASCSSISSSTGYYITGHTVSAGTTSPAATQCPANYRSGAGTTSQADCSLTTTAGKYVASPGAGETACVSPYFCPGGVIIKYGTGTTTGGYKYCTDLGTIYTKSDAGASVNTKCYATTTSKKWIASAKATAETDCTAGYYCAGGTKVYYNSTGGRAQCTAGNYCPAGSNAMSSCTSLGSFYTTSSPGATAASACSGKTTAGKFVKAANSGEETCEAGGYCPGAVSVAYGSTGGRTACPAGTMNASTGSSTASACTTCDAGTYNTTTGSTTCSNCGTGYYCTGGSARTQCTSTSGWTTTTSTDKSTSHSACYQTQTPSGCASGTIKRTASSISGTTITYGSASVSTALSAKANYYVSGTSCPVCTGLGSFYTTSAGGAIDSSKCYGTTTAGKYIKTQNSSTQETCPAGSYCPATTVYYGKYDTSGGRVGCGAGKYNASTGSSASSACANITAGCYGTSASSSCPAVCGTNQYSIAGSSSCSSCPTDYKNSGTTAASHAGSASCIITVSAGKYIGTAGDNSSNWGTCAGGTYKAQHTVAYGSTSSCGTCSAGYYCPEGAGSQTECGGNTKYSGSGAAACSDVSSGYYSTGGTATTRTGQTKCEAGNYCSGGVKTACSTLASGFYPNSAAGSDAATDCKTNSLSGKYVASVNATSATSCAAGTYKGSHQVNYGSTSSCGTCPANSYCPAGASAAKACSTLASGFYPNSAAGSDASTDCYTNVLSGKYVASAKATGATSCAAGSFKGAHQVNYGSTSSCDSCALGSYSAVGADACTACQGGKTTSGTGKSSCDATCANNNSYDSTWANVTWSDNAVANLCQITTCAGGSKYASVSGGVAGVLPSGYTQLAYLESTGTQYIDTGVKAKQTTSIDIKAKPLSVSGGPSFFGSVINDMPNMFIGTASSGNGDLYINHRNNATGYKIQANKTYEIFVGGTTAVVKEAGGTAQVFTVSQPVASDSSMYVFASNRGTAQRLGAFDYYYVKIYEAGTLVQHLIPARRDSDGVLGMYDKVNDKFLVNAGSGKFVAGPAILKSQNTCTQCDAGTYSAGGTATSCETCANWTYSSAGAASCTACLSVPDAVGGVAWTKASGTGWDAFDDCVVTQTPVNCTSGSVKRTQSSTSAWGSTTLVSTLKSKAGYYASATATSCTICPAGSYCAANATAATACATGSYTSATGKSACTACSAGKTTSGTGKTSCDATCDNATGAHTWATPSWSANSVSNLCTVSKCNANTYYTATTGTGYKNTCTACGSNSSTSAGNTSTTCTCTTGYTSTGGVSGATTSKSGCSLISDIACAIGEYVPASSTTCSACTAGYYCPSTAKTYSYSSSIQGRTACSDGTYQPDTGKTSCTPASKGYYVSGTAKTEQTACTGATYQNETGKTSCKSCPTGYTANTASAKIAASSCQISCAAGTQVATANAQCTTPSGNWYTTASQLVNYGSTSSVNACKVATNLFNPRDYDSLWAYISSSATTVTAYDNNAIVWVPVEPNTTYIVSGMRGANTMTMANSASVPALGVKYSNYVDPGSVGKGVLYTTSSDAKYLILMGLRLADGSTTSTRQSILDKNVANLQIFKASDGYGIIGNATTDHDAAKDCTITCGPGQYVATGGSACEKVGAGYYATGGTVAQGATSSRSQCTSPLTTIGYGTGANEKEDCGRKLHAGANVIYLRSAQRSSPSLRVKVGDTTFYGALSTSLSSPLKVKNGSTTYSVVNDWQ